MLHSKLSGVQCFRLNVLEYPRLVTATICPVMLVMLVMLVGPIHTKSIGKKLSMDRLCPLQAINEICNEFRLFI